MVLILHNVEYALVDWYGSMEGHHVDPSVP